MEILSAKELSKYLKINGKKVYRPVRESKLPHVGIGGKIAFSGEPIDKRIPESTQRRRNIFIAGSDDIFLRRIIAIYNTQLCIRNLLCACGQHERFEDTKKRRGNRNGEYNPCMKRQNRACMTDQFLTCRHLKM